MMTKPQTLTRKQRLEMSVARLRHQTKWSPGSRRSPAPRQSAKPGGGCHITVTWKHFADALCTAL